jgi:hypothetical protein
MPKDIEPKIIGLPPECPMPGIGGRVQISDPLENRRENSLVELTLPQGIVSPIDTQSISDLQITPDRLSDIPAIDTRIPATITPYVQEEQIIFHPHIPLYAGISDIPTLHIDGSFTASFEDDTLSLPDLLFPNTIANVPQLHLDDSEATGYPTISGSSGGKDKRTPEQVRDFFEQYFNEKWEEREKKDVEWQATVREVSRLQRKYPQIYAELVREKGPEELREYIINSVSRKWWGRSDEEKRTWRDISLWDKEFPGTWKQVLNELLSESEENL